MTSFDERERGFETRFAQEADVLFRQRARRAKALASWVCDRTGKAEAEVAIYKERFLTFAMMAADDAVVATRLADDLAEAGMPVSPADVAAEMARLDAAAAAQDRP